ncbi:MAG: hypothetical protein NVV70_16910 [Cellulomonas sp.]|nr:hypothetical protein [Cellulomonas sp.]MCR6649727.1 hypothetical protein [Cellulomonas sp.]
MDPIVRDILIHKIAATAEDLALATWRQERAAEALTAAQDRVAELTSQHAALARYFDVDPANYHLETSDGKRTVSRKTT